MTIQEVLLDGLALNYTFHGLSAGTEYTISVTAATGAGLGTQTTITATTLQPATPGMVHICTHSPTYSSLLSYITFHYTSHLYTICAVPLYVSAQAIGSHSINVTWSVAEEDAVGVIHYEVQWSLLAADKDDNITTTTMTIQQEGCGNRGNSARNSRPRHWEPCKHNQSMNDNTTRQPARTGKRTNQLKGYNTQQKARGSHYACVRNT